MKEQFIIVTPMSSVRGGAECDEREMDVAHAGGQRAPQRKLSYDQIWICEELTIRPSS